MLLTSAISVPLIIAFLLVWRPARRVMTVLAPWGALPALVVAVTATPGTRVQIDWLLLGARVVLDEVSQVFLLFSAILWLAAGVYARSYLAGDPRRHRFQSFFLLTMAGNFGLIIAGDMLTFYVCFAVMSFASYPLIIHGGRPDELYAGRVYILLVIAGELLLFTGIMATAAIAGRVDLAGAPAVVAAAPAGPVVMTLLLAGFGIKVGALPLHVWLPLAHPAAPTPASAVLSGALIKAGLIGWFRFLPLGDVSLPILGAWCVGAGLTAAFGGVLVGLTQTNVKSALAYSSISQMGFLTVGVGTALAAPGAWPLLLPALVLYATHHALAKGALFLGVGIAAGAGAFRGTPRAVIMIGLLLPALALAGVPLTSGAAAKVALKAGTLAAGADVPLARWLGALDIWLSAAALGTTLLMARILVLLARRPGESHAQVSGGMLVPWAALVGLSALGVWMPGGFRHVAVEALSPASVWSTLWPPLTGVLCAWVAWRQPAAARWRRTVYVPPGDLLWPVRRAWHLLAAVVAAVSPRPLVMRVRAAVRPLPRLALSRTARRLEEGLAVWSTAGALLLMVIVAVLTLLVLR